MDLEEGWVERRIFWDQATYERALEAIFARCRQFVAHDSQLPDPGDFVTAYVGVGRGRGKGRRVEHAKMPRQRPRRPVLTTPTSACSTSAPEHLHEQKPERVSLTRGRPPP